MASYVDVTDATFEEEIIRRSEQVPVVVDLWAEWCGPCRTLGPIIEKVVGETDGEVVLVKVDTDANPQLTQMFQVQGIPAVHAVRHGRVVASFVGAQPEAQVRAFVDALRPTDEERKVATLIAEGNEASLKMALSIEPANERAIVALAERYVAEKRNDEALDLLAKIPETGETRRVAALARTGAGGADGVSADPAALDGIEAKLDDLLTRVKGDDEARQEFIDLLEVLGPDDPRTADYRRRLTQLLF
jgi:putative thioredoxin